MINTVRQSPVTALFLLIVWLMYGARVSVESMYGTGVALSLFAVQFSHLEYVWTWVTAPLGHVNFAHLLFNSILALYILPPVERDLGPIKTILVYILGGAACAVLGTILVVVVRIPFLPGATDTGVMGSSSGLFVLLGLLLRQYWSYQNEPLADIGLNIKNSTLFAVLCISSLGGVVFDIWRIWAEFSFPGLGHQYHAVGLILGALIAERVPLPQNKD